MKITWKGHACFLLESGGYQLLLDPYRDVPGLTDISGSVNEVLCSHDHKDHNHTSELTVTGGVSPFVREDISAFHDDAHGTLRGQDIIRSFHVEGLHIVHLGDLGHLLSEEQIKPLAGCDVLMIPVGGTYTVDSAHARQVVEQLHPRIVIPMHYLDDTRGFPVLEPVSHFLERFSPEQIRRYDGPTLTVDKTTPAQVAVLSL